MMEARENFLTAKTQSQFQFETGSAYRVNWKLLPYLAGFNQGEKNNNADIIRNRIS